MYLTFNPFNSMRWALVFSDTFLWTEVLDELLSDSFWLLEHYKLLNLSLLTSLTYKMEKIRVPPA